MMGTTGATLQYMHVSHTKITSLLLAHNSSKVQN